jgi:hypothetical protein
MSIKTASDPGLIRLNWLPSNTRSFKGFPRRWAAGLDPDGLALHPGGYVGGELRDAGSAQG